MHKLEWDLTEFFIDDSAFYNEIETIKGAIAALKKYENIDLDAELLLFLLNKKWYIKELSNHILIYGSLKYYKNIKSDENIRLKEVAEKVSHEVDLHLHFIDTKIVELGQERVKEFLDKKTGLKIYELSLNNLFRIREHLQSEEVTTEIKDNNNLINKQLDLYNKLLGDINFGNINIKDKEVEIKLSNYGKYLSSSDRKIREQTYLVVNKAFEVKQELFADIIDKIYGYRIKNSELEGYNSVLEKELFKENINSKIIDALINTINDNLFLIQKYLRLKSDFLGIKEPHLYDFGVPLDNSLRVKYSIEEGIEIIRKALAPLGEEYLKVVDLLLDGHIDAEVNDNKHQSIIFSWHTYSFMNFRGSYIDLKDMAHEIGHIVNDYLSIKKQPYIYENSTMFIGETASIVNELLLNKYLYKNAQTKEEKIFYLSKQIENYFTSVFKQTMYTEFENDLYNERKTKKLSSDLLNRKYCSLIRKYYGSDVLYDDLSGIEWTRLGRLYRWSYNSYNYATGLIMASVVVNSLLDSKTLTQNEYIDFLSSGSNAYSLDLLRKINIDLTDTNIINNGLKVLEEDIYELEKNLLVRGK